MAGQWETPYQTLNDQGKIIPYIYNKPSKNLQLSIESDPFQFQPSISIIATTGVLPKFNHTIENIQTSGTGLITGALEPYVNYGPINFERESNHIQH